MKDRLVEIQAMQPHHDDQDLNARSIEISIEDRPQLLMEDFFNEVDNLDSELDIIRDHLQQVSKAYNDFITTPSVTEDKREALEKMISIIQNSAKRVRTTLKDLEAAIEKDDHSVEF